MATSDFAVLSLAPFEGKERKAHDVTLNFLTPYIVASVHKVASDIKNNKKGEYVNHVAVDKFAPDKGVFLFRPDLSRACCACSVLAAYLALAKSNFDGALAPGS